ncbi:MAG: D-alanine--D-alanine ligase A, partial [Aquiluna sp.]|nr:D-alanine--D-alanine ligase A [Aquiluna sp.]
MQRLALIYGGESSEHSVSCVTAVGVISAIDTSKYEVIPVGITKTGKFVLEPIDPEWKLENFPEVSEEAPELLLPLGGGELRMASGISLGKIDIA